MSSHKVGSVLAQPAIGTNPSREAAQWLVYPVLMIGSLAGLWGLMSLGAPVSWAPYLVIALFGPAVLLAEQLLPYRTDWMPRKIDFLNDVLYLGAVQVVLPLSLVWATLWLIQDQLGRSIVLFDIWPGTWPILAQLALKIIVGDFFRYWLHRFAHTFDWLWKLHAVHHQPEKLYTTNVFRFHPFEKALQFLADTLPFMLIGIGPEALAFYFVFYAMSGLFQHSNCDVRLGWLNYVVSGPELHRWHHSEKISESNANYAHSFVVWDLLFGTYFRPGDRVVERTGLLERDYPRNFLGQLLAPFRSYGKSDGA